MENDVVLTPILKRKANIWTAECKELGTVAFGESIEKAKESIEEAIDLHLDAFKEVGERRRFLEEQGAKLFVGRHNTLDHSHSVFADTFSLPRHNP